MYCQGNDCKLWAKLPIAVARFKLELRGKKSELLTSKKNRNISKRNRNRGTILR